MCTYWQLGNFQFPTHKPSREAGWASWEMTWFLCLSGLWSVVLSCSSLSTTAARENTRLFIFFCVLLLQSYFLVLINYLMPDSWCLCTWWLCLYIFMISWFTESFMLLIYRLGCIAASLPGYAPNGPKGCDEVATPPSSLFNFRKSCANPALGVEIVSFHSFG